MVSPTTTSQTTPYNTQIYVYLCYLTNILMKIWLT